MLNSISYGTQKHHSPRRRAGGTLPPAWLFLTVTDEEKFFISGLEKRALAIILYSGQAMLAFMLSF
ncbi:hypothetical protein [Klebsiella quasipneumoniae]|uniref:hypothetical protein n=1 Tax=Klebsiella quasipneumoniae TaxID=1463165 RepID=UPI001E522370|nr:hypothetical protein [Klebsiella quasipneumoniae]